MVPVVIRQPSMKETYQELRHGTNSNLAAALSESSRIIEYCPIPCNQSKLSEDAMTSTLYDTSGFIETPAISQIPFCDLLEHLSQNIKLTAGSLNNSRDETIHPVRRQQRPPSHYYQQLRSTQKTAVEFDFRNL